MNGAATSGASPPQRRYRVLLGLSGSVASIKAEQLVSLLMEWADVRVIATSHALHFFDLTAMRSKVEVYVDEDEWRVAEGAVGYTRGDPVLHIELRKWADLLLIAPLSANSLAEIAHGLCPNLLVTHQRTSNMGSALLASLAHIPPAPSHLSFSCCGRARRVWSGRGTSPRRCCWRPP